jgi:hypothetical protein
MELVPYRQSDPAPGARRMAAGQEREFLKSLEQKSLAIKDEGFVEAEWLRFCERNKHEYLSSLLGHNRIVAKINRDGLAEKLLHGREALLRAKNIACCETHREVIQTIFDHRMI